MLLEKLDVPAVIRRREGSGPDGSALQFEATPIQSETRPSLSSDISRGLIRQPPNELPNRNSSSHHQEAHRSFNSRPIFACSLSHHCSKQPEVCHTARMVIQLMSAQSTSSVISRSSTTTTLSKRMSISQRRISGFNPMAAVDVEALEASMKIAALDGLKGYATNTYGTVKQYRETDYVTKNNAGGYQAIREPAWNKGIHSNPLPLTCYFH